MQRDQSREATLADAPAIAALINRAYRVEDPFAVGDRTAPDAVAAMIGAPGSAFLMLEGAPDAPRRLLGTVFVRVAGDRGYFGPLAVDPDVQAKGIGRALVRAAESYSMARGCRHLDLDVLSVREELVGYYRSLGYEVSGTAEIARPERFRVPLHLVLMTKPLATSAPHAFPSSPASGDVRR